ncbi:hypothetical protein [Actinomadura rubrisoli]|uniref:Uncharacterized protein n=1 Tax=Actinomadura rubrisoli TaxID=2530368 RepID=A0A4R5AEP6_9ACTN|nr:hypothetical protein [Actinomadura rubrisoli]TDD69786.1 hypothetical protein E1298_37175 [Actinomadura rubrisoli]
MVGAVDWDSIVDTPSGRWMELGLHWHCYTWRGAGKDWGDDSARHNDSSEVTPSVVRNWLKKNPRLIRATHSSPEEAVGWLRELWTPVINEAMHPSSADWEFRYKLALYDLSVGTDLSWSEWVRGPSVISVGIVGTNERCH